MYCTVIVYVTRYSEGYELLPILISMINKQLFNTPLEKNINLSYVNLIIIVITLKKGI